MAALAIAGLAFGALGTVSSIYGQYQQGKAQKKAAKAQAAQAKKNAGLALQAALEAESAGVFNIGRRQLVGAQEVGASRASAAARGVMVDRGSAAAHVQDLRDATQADVYQIAKDAQTEARDIRARAEEFSAEAKLSRSRAKSATSAAALSGLATGLNGLSTVASKWQTYSQATSSVNTNSGLV